MIKQLEFAGGFALPGTSMTMNRMGYGAMQLAGREGNKLVWGPPRSQIRSRIPLPGIRLHKTMLRIEKQALIDWVNEVAKSQAPTRP